LRPESQVEELPFHKQKRMNHPIDIFNSYDSYLLILLGQLEGSIQKGGVEEHQPHP